MIADYNVIFTGFSSLMRFVSFTISIKRNRFLGFAYLNIIPITLGF